MGIRDDYIKAIKKAFVTVGQTLAMSYITAQVPPLGLPIIRQIVSWCIGKVLVYLTDSTELGAYFIYTDFRVNSQGNDFIAAALNNHRIQQTGSAEEKKASEKELMQKFADFARISS